MKFASGYKLQFSISKNLHLIYATVFSAFWLAIFFTGYFLIKAFQISAIFTLFYAFVAGFPLVLMWRDIYRDSKCKPLPNFLRA